MKKTLPIVIAVVIVGIIAFYGGMKYGSTTLQANAFQGGFRNASGTQGTQGSGTGVTQNFRRLAGGQGGGGTIGQIISGDDKSITVKLPNGGSKIVFFSGTTKITKSADATVVDLASGVTVMANGTTNSDGSVTATSIQINPPVQEQKQPPIQAGTQQQEPPQITQQEPTPTTPTN